MEKFGSIKLWVERHSGLIATLIAATGSFLAALYLTPQAVGLILSPLEADPRIYRHVAPEISLTFLDANGNELGHQGAAPGQYLPLSALPDFLPAAFLATEDRRFFHHHGLDFVGLTRAIYLDLRAGKYVAGGSTITQQTAKIIYAGHQRNLARKEREFLEAARLERTFSKNEILEIYLNNLYLGDNNYGVDAAAKDYFGVSAQKLSLPQAAMLAALTRSPTRYSPRRDLAGAQLRATTVLKAMVKTGAIPAPMAAYAIAHPAVTIERDHDSHGYFLDAASDAARQLVEGLDVPSGSLVVHTTLESPLQAAAEEAVSGAVHASGKKLKFSQAAMVVLKPDGAVSALVGGVDYASSVFDRITQAHRQPGSAFKPFVYLAALQAGLSPWESRDDTPVEIAGYQPRNYQNASYGRLRLADALAHSVNTITVNLAQEVGVANVVAAARQLGIASPLAPDASLALGTNEVTPLELTAAYCVLANGGQVPTPYFITAIETSQGKLLFERKPDASRPVLADSVRRDMTAMLYKVVVNGTGTAARLANREAAGKTGTTQNYRDAWFLGFTTDYVAGVWIGNDDSSGMRQVTGGSVPAQIWKTVLTAAEKDRPSRPLDRSPEPAPDVDEIIAAAANAIPGDEDLVQRGTGFGPGATFAMSSGPPSRPRLARPQDEAAWLSAPTANAPPPQRGFAQVQPQSPAPIPQNAPLAPIIIDR